jgi:phosphate transport system permease protein
VSLRRRKGSSLPSQAIRWLLGGSLAFDLLLIVGLLLLIAQHGLAYFWQRPLVELELGDGARVLGEVHDRESTQDGEGSRMRLKTGNRDVTGSDFRWIDQSQVKELRRPDDAVLLERLEWGNFYGYLRELRRGDEVLARGERAWPALRELHTRKLRELAAIRALEKGRIGDVNWEIEQLRLSERRLELRGGDPAALARLSIEREDALRRYGELVAELNRRRVEFEAETVLLATADGRERLLPVGFVVRALRPNQLGLFGKLRLYASRVGEFVWDDPRESNTEGGIFPAIFGTVMMVFLMSFAVAPFGVVAAIYLQEYAREGFMLQLVRIAVNNLAGVPSIVFGVFGLGFFVYVVGGSIDQLFYSEALPTPTYGTGGILWASLTLALLTVPVVIVATEEGLAAVPRAVREGSRALGATQFETLRRTVVPAAAPGIMTGIILAIARAAGEVAPLMIVGMVKLAPSLPIDSHFPYLHLERKFMHLGFHIYDVGFQSSHLRRRLPESQRRGGQASSVRDSAASDRGRARTRPGGDRGSQPPAGSLRLAWSGMTWHSRTP